MVNLTIDGMDFQAKEGSTLLEVARENGIEIPTLCYNEALGPEGRCRLCMVEIKRGSRTRLVTSCLYPVEEGLQVQTQTEKVLLTRKMVVELLLARCPDCGKDSAAGRKDGGGESPVSSRTKETGNAFSAGCASRPVKKPWG